MQPVWNVEGLRYRLRLSSLDLIRFKENQVNFFDWDSIRHECRQFLLGFCPDKKADYIDDLVDDALVENIEIILSPSITPAEVSRKLERSLVKKQLQTIRNQSRCVPYKPIHSPLVLSDVEFYIASEYLTDVFMMIARSAESALQALTPREYNIIAEYYNISTKKDYPAIGYDSISPRVHNIITYRARRRFLTLVERSLLIISAGAPTETQAILKTALRLIRSTAPLAKLPNFSDAFSLWK
jgi:hypothetical protein